MPSEYVIRWAGARIGSGATVFHFAGTNSPSAAQAAVNAFAAWSNTIAASLPTGVSVRGDSEVRVMTSAGVLTAVLPVTQPAPYAGAGGTAFINGAGGMVRWNTSSVVNGRRLLGRSYLVPLNTGAFSLGNLTNSAITAFTNAGTTLIGALASNGTPMQVWSRKGQVVAEVNGCSVPSRPSTLRTRNDRD